MLATRKFDVIFDVRVNEWLNEQWTRQSNVTPCNVLRLLHCHVTTKVTTARSMHKKRTDALSTVDTADHGHPMINFNTLRPRQNGRRFADDTFKLIFLNENVRISIKISLKFVPKGPINNNPALVQIMTWRRSGDKPLSEPMMVCLLTHICVARPQWVRHFADHKQHESFYIHSLA